MAKNQQLLKCEYADCVLAYNQQKILTQSLKKKQTLKSCFFETLVGQNI